MSDTFTRTHDGQLQESHCRVATGTNRIGSWLRGISVVFALCLWAFGIAGCGSLQDSRDSRRDSDTTFGIGTESGTPLAPR